jgi:fluoroquinolone transport system ATP-binding protein
VAFERPNHFLKLTALENLRYFRSLYRSETEEPQRLLELVGLREDANRRVGQFSKGMKVRLNFARALLNKPQLLFLDEPTTGLDPVNAQIIKDKIRALQQDGTTVFLTTHNMSVADEVCDRVAFIIDGRLELIDSPRELKMRYGKRLVRVEYGSDGTVESQDFALDALSDNDDFQQLLGREDLQTIHSQETTLENIFIQVTGRNLA